MGLALVDTGAAGPELRQIGKHRTEVTEATEGGLGLALVETGVAGRSHMGSIADQRPQRGDWDWRSWKPGFRRQQDAELSSPRFFSF